MDYEGLLISERIDEVTRLCAREHPIYEHVSNFSAALYIIGHIKSSDMMSADDLDACEAASILKEYFTPVRKEDLPAAYDIRESEDKYLLVIGNPSFPEHFAVLVDMHGAKPYFSKLKFFGCGFDSFEELAAEYLGKDGIGPDDVAYYKMKHAPSVKIKASLLRKIYTVRDDGSYSIFEDESLTYN
ncbi:MAG: hypothetical protein VR64_15850 [Desulfatitalea sp. BRH_c12]|nr:MAG: hypothetical protein VR64_15850 [Desulfatitalea sp. BRH_c12]